MQLFVAEKHSWEKTASAELEEDATQWPRQVLTELFRVLPEISEYTPDVKFMKTNEEQGYALGVVVVTNSTNSALTGKGMASGPTSPKALIPIVIKNGRLLPLDTVMASSGRMYPLTVDRLREVLYRPESFELMSDDWGDASLSALFAPPGRGDFGTGQGGSQGVQYMQGPGMKQAADNDNGRSSEMPMLDAIEGTVLGADIEKYAQSLDQDSLLVDAMIANPAMADAMAKLSSMTPVTTDTALAYEGVLQEMHPAQVAHMRFDEEAGCYAVKTANRDHGIIRTMHMDRGEFIRFVGEKLAARVDTEGTVVAAEESQRAVIVPGGGGSQPKLIDHAGQYCVFEATTGKQLKGFAIPNLIDAAGELLPLTLFVAEQGATTQGQIAGISQYSDVFDLPRDPPKGVGCFYVGRNSDLRATLPVQVHGSSSDKGATRYRCSDAMTGEELTIVLQRGMEAVLAFPKRKELILPWGASFVSLARELPELVASAPDAMKTASYLLEGTVVVSSAPGDIDNYRIRCTNVPKLAAEIQRPELSYDEALFSLCVAGLGPIDAFAALNKVATEGRCEVAAIDLGGAPKPDSEKIAGSIAEIRAIRPSLLKEAAAIPDSMTVDAILGLDFINSENVRTFISMIPYLEKALNKTCELVFASRLGLSEIPEAAAARAARGLNDAIRGLKALALRQIEELP
jgi:hypothetical protein